VVLTTVQVARSSADAQNRPLESQNTTFMPSNGTAPSFDMAALPGGSEASTVSVRNLGSLKAASYRAQDFSCQLTQRCFAREIS
jgi:hypothetical protein